MKAITWDRYGSADVLVYADVPEPELDPDRVLVRVRAASLNPLDWRSYSSDPWLVRLGNGLLKPKQRNILGADFAGEVIEVGANISDVTVGDRVFGAIGKGSCAEIAKMRRNFFTRIPAGVSYEDAAATPIAALTALQGLREVVTAGTRVLVNGASGGVGHAAVQIAVALGATVDGVCSGRNVEMVRSLGATEVFDYETTDFTRSGATYDVIYDTVGTQPFRRLTDVMTADGTLIIAGSIGGGKLLGPMTFMLAASAAARFASQSVSRVASTVVLADLVEIAGMLAARTLKPVIQEVYPLERAAEASRLLEKGHVAGKLVISIP